MTKLLLGGIIGLALLMGMPLLTGCHSTQPKSTSFASITLTNVSPGEISETVQQVFHEQGFMTARASFSHIVLEREGSSWNNLVWGNWTTTGQVWQRVKIDVAPQGEKVSKVLCNVFMLRDRNGPTEEEIKIHSGRGKYQDLLEEVARRFHQGPAK